MKKVIAVLLSLILVALLGVSFLIYRLMIELDKAREVKPTAEAQQVQVKEEPKESTASVETKGNADPFASVESGKQGTDESLELSKKTPAVDLTKVGKVAGKICYPGEGIPALTVYLKNTVTNAVLNMDMPANSTSYSFTAVPAGNYVAFAWLDGGKLGGSYSKAVPCGLTVSCTDHSPIQVKVEGGKGVTGVDICDWYSPDSVPAKPKTM